MVAAPSISYSITVRLEIASGGTAVSQLTTTVEEAGGIVTALDVAPSTHDHLRVDLTRGDPGLPATAPVRLTPPGTRTLA